MCLCWKILFVLKVMVYRNMFKVNKWGWNTQLFYFINLKQFIFQSVLWKDWNIPASVLTSFERCVVDRPWHFLVWFGKDSEADKRALQRVVRSALKMTNSCLPSLEDIYTSRCRTRVKDDDDGALKQRQQGWGTASFSRRWGPWIQYFKVPSRLCFH